MTDIFDWHNTSMKMAENAMVARIRGDHALSIEYFREALKLETQAASMLQSDSEAEPTRSILYRSAASLALECSEWREAERLASAGLSGYPPAEIIEELREVHKQTLFMNRLEKKGLVLEANELTISIAGAGAGTGIAQSDIVLDRLSNFKTLAERTADRIGYLPYRVAGQSKISSKYPVFIRAFTPGSFNITLTIGRPDQLLLPGFESSIPAVDIIREILNCIQLLNQRQEHLLRERISDPAYFNNFVVLMNKIAPDGDAVQSVGFTTHQDGKQHSVQLLRKQAEISRIPKSASEKDENWNTGEIREIAGKLRYADAIKYETSGSIKLLNEEGKRIAIKVPQGMDDIIGPLWSQQVIATVSYHKNIYQLVDIRRADQS